MRLFLSYRRADSAGYSGRLHDALVQQLGPDGVFQDVATIAPGQDFTVAIDRALDGCDAVLALIGPGWPTAAAPDGTPRLEQPDDYVRLELARALERDLPVVPVLVGGAELPSAEALPEELRPLLRRQAETLRDSNWHRDVAALVARLRGEPAAAVARSRVRRGLAVSGPRRGLGRVATGRRWGIGAIAALVAAGLVLWSPWAGPAGRQTGDVAATMPAPTGEDQGSAEEGGVVKENSACEAPEGPGWNRLVLSDDPTGDLGVPRGSFLFEVRGASWRELEPGLWRVVLATTMENATPIEDTHGDWLYQALIVGARAFPKQCFTPDPPVLFAETIGDALVGFDVRCEPTGYIELVLRSAESVQDEIPVTSPALEPSDC